ncbi:MAG: DinB family protein [Planctomycetales bacterium]
MSIPRLEFARKQIAFARGYTLTLLEDVGDDDWFRRPGDCPTHLAWQVGHLTMAQYMLTLFRLRGKQDEDADFITKSYLRRFLKGTEPKADADAYPSPEEILSTLAAVHDHVLRELEDYPDDQLDEPVVEPWAVSANRFGSLIFCAQHEMLHAGQIGLLRRALGKSPIR